MTKYGSDKVAFFLIDGYDVMGTRTQLEEQKEALTEEIHGHGEEWARFKHTGLKRCELSQEGFYDDSQASINDALKEKTGDNRTICYGLSGNSIGSSFTGFSGALQVNFNRIASRGGLHRANASYQGDGRMDEGKILHPHQKMEGDGDTEESPLTAEEQTNAGGVAYLQVSELNLDDFNSVQISILHSADEQTWDTLADFTAITAAPASERITVEGDVKKHLVVNVVFSGGGEVPNEEYIKFMTGFVRNPSTT